MHRYALASLFGIWLTGCAHTGTGASTVPADAASLVDAAVCASRAPLVARVLVDGRPALAELRAALQGAVERLSEGQRPTDHQMQALREIAEALEDVAACL